MTRQRILGVVLIAAITIAGAAAFVERARLAQLPYFKVLIGERRQDTAPAPAAAGATASRGDVAIDARRQQLMGVETVTVTRGDVAGTVRAPGIVRADETRLTDINVKVDGWIRDLAVDYTGRLVHAGDPLFTLYSPDLLATEQEYLLALRTRDALRLSQVPDAVDRAGQLVAAARQRLSLWDVTDDQIAQVEQARHADGVVVFRSPASGIVLEKPVVKGAHVTPGQMLYKLADLSTVWVEANVHEDDIALVHVGATADVVINAYPGRRFSGRLIYVNPLVDEVTRTATVRFQFANREGLLKPGMYAGIELRLSASPGLIVPANAILDSGTEQVVFVAKGDGFFEPRRVKIGRRIGGHVQVVDGLSEGERVASGAAFFLDSESQLRAGLQGYSGSAPPAAAPPAAGPAAAVRESLAITLRFQPDPPKSGETRLEVAVKNAAGEPVDDAEVRVEFYMAAMPTMGMPAMRNAVALAHATGGAYRGTGEILGPGRWDVTVTVTRGGQRIGAKTLSVVAQ